MRGQGHEAEIVELRYMAEDVIGHGGKGESVGVVHQAIHGARSRR